MNQENYKRLNELSFARENAKPHNAKRSDFKIWDDAYMSLWIKASCYISDEDAAKMIASLEADIVSDAIYYANKIEEKA